MQPNLVAHADWSKDPKKRWCAAAVLEADGHYLVSAPTEVGSLLTYFIRLRRPVGAGVSVFTGFDFPIGLPERYATKVGLTDFRAALPRFGRDEWRHFYEPAGSQSAISATRPFYPAGDSTGTKRQHLVDALGLADNSDLKRRCERSAEALFWLVGPKQVGKAAISGWRDLLVPASAIDTSLSIWPFDGRLSDLLARPGIVVAETYPADTYRHLALAISESSRKKGRQPDRAADASTMRAWAHTNGVRLTSQLKREIDDGFGPHSNGEDRFDAVVGLFGMLDVVLGNLASGEPEDDTTKIEGWILGYSDA